MTGCIHEKGYETVQNEHMNDWLQVLPAKLVLCVFCEMTLVNQWNYNNVENVVMIFLLTNIIYDYSNVFLEKTLKISSPLSIVFS